MCAFPIARRRDGDSTPTFVSHLHREIHLLGEICPHIALPRNQAHVGFRISSWRYSFLDPLGDTYWRHSFGRTDDDAVR
jgi:hypothetical protein